MYTWEKVPPSSERPSWAYDEGVLYVERESATNPLVVTYAVFGEE